MKHIASESDCKFKSSLEAFEFPVSDFDHRAHVRLAYTYLTEHSVKESVDLMRETLTALLRHVGIDPSEKYHETLTEAWILAVNHFMDKSERCVSADEFIDRNEVLLDSKIMLTHYSAELLFSDAARRSFVEPDLDPIPRSGGGRCLRKL